MKRAITLVFVIVFGISLLSACGAKNTPPSGGKNTAELTVNNAEFGSISIEYPDDGSFEAEVAADDINSLPFSFAVDNNIDSLRATIEGSEFSITLGYADYRNYSGDKTYEMRRANNETDYNKGDSYREATYGGKNCYTLTIPDGVVILIPSANEGVGWAVAIHFENLGQSFKDQGLDYKGVIEKKYEWLENPEIQKILDTIEIG